mgnify:CR=1 FL=1
MDSYKSCTNLFLRRLKLQYLFEYSDTLNSPYEVFLFDTTKNKFPVRSHWHYFMEIIYMLQGTALIDCNQESYIVKPGDLFLFHPQAVHSIFGATDEPIKFIGLKFDMNRLKSSTSYTSNLGAIFQSALKDPLAPICLSSNSFDNLHVRDLFFHCMMEMNEKHFGYDLLVQAQICSLLIDIIRLWRNNGFDTDKAISLHTDLNSIYSITEYIDAHSHEQLKVKYLASKCNMSYSYFAKNFREFYGQSCKDYIERVKICKVEDFLLFTDFDLTYISQETG